MSLCSKYKSRLQTEFISMEMAFKVIKLHEIIKEYVNLFAPLKELDVTEMIKILAY